MKEQVWPWEKLKIHRKLKLWPRERNNRQQDSPCQLQSEVWDTLCIYALVTYEHYKNFWVLCAQKVWPKESVMHRKCYPKKLQLRESVTHWKFGGHPQLTIAEPIKISIINISENMIEILEFKPLFLKIIHDRLRLPLWEVQGVFHLWLHEKHCPLSQHICL